MFLVINPSRKWCDDTLVFLRLFYIFFAKSVNLDMKYGIDIVRTTENVCEYSQMMQKEIKINKNTVHKDIT